MLLNNYWLFYLHTLTSTTSMFIKNKKEKNEKKISMNFFSLTGPFKHTGVGGGSYSKTMLLSLGQVYYWRLKSNTHNNYNYIIKTRWNYFNWKLFTTERETPSKVGLGLR